MTERHPELNVLIAMAGVMLPEDLHSGAFLPDAVANGSYPQVLAALSGR